MALRHLALIMDGNGRWAKQRSLPRTAGHLEGLKACKRVILSASELGIEYLSFYVFSTENSKRPEQEVSYLMFLLADKLPGEIPWFVKNNIKIRFRGDFDMLSARVQQGITKTVNETSSCTGLCVVLCINYGGRNEIVNAVNRFIEKNPGSRITETTLREQMPCSDIPQPDLIARSAGEYRISNFLLWDSAYSELLFIEKLWPDWGKDEIQLCIDSFSKRIRKFGGLANE